MNPVAIEAALSELALQPFYTAEFAFQFLAALRSKDLSACAQNMQLAREARVPATKAASG